MCNFREISAITYRICMRLNCSFCFWKYEQIVAFHHLAGIYIYFTHLSRSALFDVYTISGISSTIPNQCSDSNQIPDSAWNLFYPIYVRIPRRKRKVFCRQGRVQSKEDPFVFWPTPDHILSSTLLLLLPATHYRYLGMCVVATSTCCTYM